MGKLRGKRSSDLIASAVCTRCINAISPFLNLHRRSRRREDVSKPEKSRNRKTKREGRDKEGEDRSNDDEIFLAAGDDEFHLSSILHDDDDDGDDDALDVDDLASWLSDNEKEIQHNRY